MAPDAPAGRKPWQPMKVTHAGNVSDLVLGGETGKVTTTAGDPGEPQKKPPGGGGG